MFKYFDTNSKGNVDFDEFCRVLEKTGMYYPKAQLRALFESYDQNQSGKIDYRELAFQLFGEYVKPQQEPRKPQMSQNR